MSVDRQKAQVEAEKIYTKIIDRAREKRDEMAKKKEVAEAAEKKKLESLAADRPSNLLVSVIDKRIAAFTENRSNADADMHSPVNQDDHLEWSDAEAAAPAAGAAATAAPAARYATAADTIHDRDAEQLVEKLTRAQRKKNQRAQKTGEARRQQGLPPGQPTDKQQLLPARLAAPW